MKTELSAKRPQGVLIAVTLLWTSLAAGLAKTFIDQLYLTTIAPAALTNFVFTITFLVIVFLNLKISAGRNWARITFLILFIIGVLPSLLPLRDEFSRSAILGTLSVVQNGLQGYALFLLFTKPGSGWFRKIAPVC